MKNIFKTKTFQSSVIILLLVFSLLIFLKDSKPGLKPSSKEVTSIQIMHPIYVADFTDDNILVGASHNVFVGKVIEEVDTKERGIGPETQYKVEIIENVKGDLKGEVIINQAGGYKDGVLYIMEDGSDILSESKKNDEYMLKVGSAYLLATRYNQKEDWHTLNSFYTAKKLISKEEKDNNKLKTLAQTDERVIKLKNAYKNEILLDADVKNNNARNSYKSIEKVQKKDEIKETEKKNNPSDGSDITMNWDSALTSCTQSGKRLPTKEELEALIPSYTSLGLKASSYWSSTEVSNMPASVYAMNFGRGKIFNAAKSNNYFVHCVSEYIEEENI